MTIIAYYRMLAWPLLGLVGSAAILMIGIALDNFRENIYTIALAACIPVAMLFLSAFVGSNISRIKITISGISRQAIRHLAAFIEPADDRKVYVMTHMLDEPILYLRFIVLCNTILESLYAGIAWLIRRRNGLITTIALIAAWRFSVSFTSGLLSLLALLAGLIVFGLAVNLILALCIILTEFGLRNNRLGLGGEAFMAGLLYRISIRRISSALRNNGQYAFVKRMRKPLFHSIYYRNTACALTIAAWINNFLDHRLSPQI